MMLGTWLFFIAQIAAAVQQTSLSARQNAAVETYVRDTERLQSGRGGISVERVYTDALRFRDLLAGSAAPDPSIEEISASEFEALRRRLPGIILNREEVILAEPDPGYFADLAARHGDRVDREFFALLRTTFPDGIWPVYMEQQTDVTGCTRFGEGHLVQTYRKWTEFRRLHAVRYRSTADRIVDDIEQQLTSTCACGDRDSVLRELEEFAAAFPKSRVHAAVVARIRELTTGIPVVRFNCESG